MDAQRTGFLLGGHWIVDINKRIDHWPAPETLAIVEDERETNGGAAFNLACDLARLLPGVPLRGMGLVGDDAQGLWLLSRCAALNVDTGGLHVGAGVPTASTEVMTEKGSGRRTFFFRPGACTLVDESHFDLTDAPEKIFFLGYLGLLEKLDRLDADGTNGNARLLAQASAQGMITAADLVSAPNERLAEQLAPCLPHLDILFANEWEAARLLGSPLEEGARVAADQLLELAALLLDRGVRRAVVLHCSGGGVAATRADGRLAQGAVRVPAEDIVGTVGAGDAFAAGYLTGVHEGMDAAACLELAVCAAAASLRAVTCSDSMTTWKNCLAYGRGHGFRSL